MKTIRSWSFSRLADFEECPFKAKLKLIDKIPEPERPLPAGKTEHANDRGTRIHTECENFVRGTGELPVEAKHFKEEFFSLKDHFKNGTATLEGEWGFDKNWQVADWKLAWLRLKLDANIHISNEHAVVVDYKTGKRFGNEIKHGEQCNLYALSTFLRFPAIQCVTTELWYLDADELASVTITRDSGLRLLKGFDKRGRKMTEATEFPANPNSHSCRYCPYHPAKGTGDCLVGV